MVYKDHKISIWVWVGIGVLLAVFGLGIVLKLHKKETSTTIPNGPTPKLLIDLGGTKGTPPPTASGTPTPSGTKGTPTASGTPTLNSPTDADYTQLFNDIDNGMNFYTLKGINNKLKPDDKKIIIDNSKIIKDRTDTANTAGVLFNNLSLANQWVIFPFKVTQGGKEIQIFRVTIGGYLASDNIYSFSSLGLQSLSDKTPSKADLDFYSYNKDNDIYIFKSRTDNPSYISVQK